MKTVIDAVNELKSDVLNIQNYNETKKSIRFNEDDEDEYLGFFLSNFDKQRFSDFVCTVDEFNACVDELSAATWIDGISIEEWKAGMKNTVIDSHGNELEIGKVYEFSDNGVNWFPSALVCLTGSEYQYCASSAKWIIIRECQSPLGTIKKAPIKLVDGKAYQFELSKAVYCGFFNEKDDCFCVSTANDAFVIGYLSGCTNILALNYESK